MSKKLLKKRFLDEGEVEEKEIERKDSSAVVPWSNPNELKATDRITSTTQRPDTSRTRRKVSSARYQDTSPGAEPLSMPGPVPRHPMFIEEESPGAVLVPGIDSDVLTIEEGYDEPSTIATREEESTINVIARAVDTEEESRMRHELDELRQMQIRHELDQLDNPPVLTPVIATGRDVENQNENVRANHDDSPSSDNPKCGSKGRRWFAISAILLIVVAVTVTLALVLQPEPPDPLEELLSSTSSDGGVALADPSTLQNKAFTWLAGNPNLANYTDQQKIQLYALATLFYTTDGENWSYRHDWLSNKDVCGNWYQYPDTTFKCTTNGTVPSLDLQKNNLQGVIPPEIGMLSDSLDYLWLAGNKLEGTIPTEIGELTKLTSLSLYNNSLIGAIPSVIGFLMNLELLWLDNNELNGTLWTEIGDLTKLTDLSLASNRLMGTIFPKELGLLTKLTFLDLDTNRLTGTIPPSIGTFTELDFLDLGHNNLSGKIPTELGLLIKLTALSLGVNEFTGTIPSELGLLTNLTFLDLSRNGFTGTVPTTFNSLTLLKKLLLYDNDLTRGLLDILCGMEVEFVFAANTCKQEDEVNCTCCTHCCDLEGNCDKLRV